jgi:SAM-dependent methyltransferase
VSPNVFTNGGDLFNRICDFIHENMKKHDYSGKSVLDIGARDCLHSLRAEKLGASSILAVDNDISIGARDFIIPLLESKIKMRHQNLYDIPEKNEFDIVQFFGVLYHLRFPFNGLKKVAEACKIGGTIFIEGGFLVCDSLENMEILWCPSPERSPYDPSSVTFFNACAMDATMKTLGCEPILKPAYWEHSGDVRRGFFAYKKTEQVNYSYWTGLHNMHTIGGHKGSDWIRDSV